MRLDPAGSGSGAGERTPLRTSNPIEGTLATVRLQAYRTHGPGSRQAGLAMSLNLAQKAGNGWRKLNGRAKPQDMVGGVLPRIVQSF